MVAEELGIKAEDNRWLTAMNNVNTTAGGIGEAVTTFGVETARSLFRGLDGNSNTNGWQTFTQGVEKSVDTFLNAWNNGVGNASSRWEEQHPTQVQPQQTLKTTHQAITANTNANINELTAAPQNAIINTMNGQTAK